MTIWFDGGAQRARVDVYDGLDSEYHRDGDVYVHSPEGTRYGCIVADEEMALGTAATYVLRPHTNAVASPAAEAAPEAGPVLRGGLPVFEHWEFAGETTYDGRAADKWVYEHTARTPLNPLAWSICV